MEEIFKKIQKYKDSIDGPFFCIISGAHATASLAKNMSAGVMLKACIDQIWEARGDKGVTPATYMEFVMFCAIDFLKEHGSKLTQEDAIIFNHLSRQMTDLASSWRKAKKETVQ